MHRSGTKNKPLHLLCTGPVTVGVRRIVNRRVIRIAGYRRSNGKTDSHDTPPTSSQTIEPPRHGIFRWSCGRRRLHRAFTTGAPTIARPGWAPVREPGSVTDDRMGRLLMTRDREQFARALGRIAVDGHAIEAVMPADEDVDAVYGYLIGGR